MLCLGSFNSYSIFPLVWVIFVYVHNVFLTICTQCNCSSTSDSISSKSLTKIRPGMSLWIYSVDLYSVEEKELNAPGGYIYWVRGSYKEWSRGAAILLSNLDIMIMKCNRSFWNTSFQMAVVGMYERGIKGYTMVCQCGHKSLKSCFLLFYPRFLIDHVRHERSLDWFRRRSDRVLADRRRRHRRRRQLPLLHVPITSCCWWTVGIWRWLL